MYLKGFFFTKTKSLLRRLKSLFSNTFSPFSINLEPKRGMLLLFWCFLKLLAVVDHSQMRLWGNFFLSERSLNEYHPGAGMVWQYLRKLFNNFSTMLVTVWLLCGLFCKDVSKFFFLSVSPHIYSLYVIWTCVLHVDKGKRSNLKVRTCEDKWTVSYCISSMYRKIRSSETTSKGSI